jgi:uncharacterized protein (UPF0335 family)
MDLSNSHIKYVLGIDINLNENITCSNLNQIIIQEQLLYETFLDTVKNYAGDKFNQTIDKIKEWKDAAAVIGQILSSHELLDDFLSPLYRMVGKAVKTISDALKKMNLNSFSEQIMGFVEKIRSLKGWKKFMALVSLGSIATYINKKLKSFSPASLASFFSKNLAEDFLETISDKLTDWKTYLGYLEPIVDGVQTIYEFLQPLLSQFSKALKSGAKAGSLAIKLIKENMEQQQLRQIIREHISNIIKEEEKEELTGDISTLISNLKKLNVDIDPNKISTTLNLVKQDKTLNNAANKIMADIMIGLIKADDISVLTKIFQNIKNIKVK